MNVNYDVYRIRTAITQAGSTVDAGFFVDRRDRETREVRWERLDQGGVLVCNPIPDGDALPEAELDDAITQALTAATAAGVTGKRLTPFLLATLARTTGGRAVKANRALARHNADVGAALAVALAAL